LKELFQAIATEKTFFERFFCRLSIRKKGVKGDVALIDGHCLSASHAEMMIRQND
jgi:hypothetical protein